GAVRLCREPRDGGGLGVGEPRGLVGAAEVAAPVAPRLALGALALEIVRRADVGDVRVEGYALREPLGRHHAPLALHGVPPLERNSSTSAGSRRGFAWLRVTLVGVRAPAPPAHVSSAGFARAIEFWGRSRRGPSRPPR